jgi:ribosome recycling factor
MNEFTAPFEEKMKKTIAFLKQDYATIRAGRANPALLDKISVDYYGALTPINQLASISVTEARTMVITPYDRSAKKSIEKAIQASDLGINPQDDGTVLRLVFPPLTEERRRELCRHVAKLGEESKIAIRAIRRDANDRLKIKKKNGEISEDLIKGHEKETQDITEKYCNEVDGIVAAKEKEIMEV